ncbi:MAG TPA: LysE family transporter [Chitinophagaceae bacterium]|nr:LysE family transporter [Chitinophagaceae bacterium]
MTGALIQQGLILGLMLSISVGPVIFSIIRQSLTNGIRGGMIFIAGVSASDVTLVVLGNAFTELFRSLLKYKTPIGITGSILLIVLGIYTVFFKKIKVNEVGDQVVSFDTKELVKIFLAGYLINTLNPGAIIFWIMATTPFITYTLLDRITLFATCLSVVFLTDVLKVILAGKIRQKLTPKIIHIINIISGMVLIGFGVVLIWGLLVYKSTV